MDNNNHNESGTPADVISFVDKFKSQKELQEYAKKQFVTLLQANKKIKELEKDNSNLKSLLQQASTVMVGSTQRIHKSPEEITCELEIEKLHAAATQRELDLNEVRKLEILVKTLYAARTKTLADMESEFNKPKEVVDQSELLRIATSTPNHKES